VVTKKRLSSSYSSSCLWRLYFRPTNDAHQYSAQPTACLGRRLPFTPKSTLYFSTVRCNMSYISFPVAIFITPSLLLFICPYSSSRSLSPFVLRL